MSSHGKLQLQLSSCQYISGFAVEIDNNQIGVTNIHLTKAKLEMLNSHWTWFESGHEEPACSKSDISLGHEYFKKEVYEVMTQCYVKVKAAQDTRIAELETMEFPPGVSLANLSISRNSQSFLPHLPGISISEFSECLQNGVTSKTSLNISLEKTQPPQW